MKQQIADLPLTPGPNYIRLTLSIISDLWSYPPLGKHALTQPPFLPLDDQLFRFFLGHNKAQYAVFNAQLKT